MSRALVRFLIPSCFHRIIPSQKCSLTQQSPMIRAVCKSVAMSDERPNIQLSISGDESFARSIRGVRASLKST